MTHKPAPDIAKRKVLVVDNLDESRQLLTTWLTRRGYSVVEANGGQEAIEIAQREVPALILMDLRMPSLDGYGAAKSIKSHLGLRDIPIIAVSGDGTEYSKSRATEAGFSEYLTKPLDADELHDLLARFLPLTEAASR